ncbi:MAG: glycoside hydrolase family 3 protein [Gemmatimonadota bacterium]|nr:glycoside hydrolase family 3 protein [Gemmatimonadota bacterium]
MLPNHQTGRFQVPALAVAACSIALTVSATLVAQRPRKPSDRAPSPSLVQPPDHWVDSVLAGMSLRDRAAQMVWPNIYADYVPADAASWRRVTSYVANDRVGGILMSIGSPIEMAVKLNALQRMSALPLLVGADLETGAGMRARGGYFLPNSIDLGGATVFPSEMAYGAANDTSLTYTEGRITAIEGRALGIHIDFAPVMDVNNNPANPVINTRSYGEDPHEVARLGASFIRGLQEHGMIATAKHFPGHGDTETNSHLALPIVNVSRARLDSVELVPFRAAIRAGVGAVMTFHGSMPALDTSGAPGTLSVNVVTGLLRKQMGFTGLVISDAMDMKGVTDKYGPTEAVKRAVTAGVDVLIQPLDVPAAINAVVEGVSEGRYTEARVSESARRILAMKRQLNLDRDRYANLDSLRATVGDSMHVALAQQAADRSITVVRDSLHILPLKLAAGAKVLSITIARRSDLGASEAFNAILGKAIPALHNEFVMSDDPAPNYPRLATLADSADITIVSSYVGQSWNVTSVNAPQAFADFIARISANRRKVVVVAFGNPYLLSQIPAAGDYVVAWDGAPASQQSAARVLLGVTPASGHLPITIPPVAKRGTGLTLTP